MAIRLPKRRRRVSRGESGSDTRKREKRSSDGGWLTRGEDAATKARERIQRTFRNNIYLKAGESAEIVFLDKSPFNMNIHKMWVRGKSHNYTCPGKRCPLCAVHSPSFVQVFRVIDTRKIYKKDPKTGKIDKKSKPLHNVERYLEVGMRLQGQIAKQMGKGRLYRKLSEYERFGEKMQTSYTITPVGECPSDLRGKLTPKLDPVKDYAPKSIEELKTLAKVLGVALGEDEDDTEDYRDEKDYLEDEDEEDNDDEDDDEDEDEDDDEYDDEDEDDDDD